MRPRLGGRGRGRPEGGYGVRITRFNEAPARWPGKRADLRNAD